MPTHCPRSRFKKNTMRETGIEGSVGFHGTREMGGEIPLDKKVEGDTNRGIQSRPPVVFLVAREIERCGEGMGMGELELPLPRT